MAARIVNGNPTGGGGREPTLQDVMRAIEELRFEVHKRIDELAAELVKVGNSFDQADERGDGLVTREGEVGAEVAEATRETAPRAEGRRRREPPTATNRILSAATDLPHNVEIGRDIVKRGAPGAAKKLRRAAATGDSVWIADLLCHLSGDERQAMESVLPSASDKPVSSERLKEAAKGLELIAVDAQPPRKRRLPVAFAGRERQDSSGRKHSGPYGRGRRRR